MTDLERLKAQRDAAWNASWVAYKVAHAAGGYVYKAARAAYKATLAAQAEEPTDD